MRKYYFALVFIAAIFLWSNCNRINNAIRSETPREAYVNGLQKSPLASNAIARRWMASGDSVLTSPAETKLPFQSRVVYFDDESNAWAWQIQGQEGRKIRSHLALSDTSHQVFMELFSVNNGTPSLITSSRDSMITHTMNQTQTVVLRIQAELLVNGSAILTVTDNPSMEFPVQGAIRADIGSFWGDPRDGGSRRHEGVDIFAERGTPVLATADGRVTRTGNGGLGGKTVWLRANGKAMYYAHLDSVSSHMGEGVSTGDTLGFVGNTGNARTTPPHLHFGIYDRGAINPLPFIDFANTETEPITADVTPFRQWGRISEARANVRPRPSTKNEPFTTLTHGNPLQVTGATGDWFRVRLPDEQQGFIYRTLVEPATNSLQNRDVSESDSLFTDYASRKPAFIADSTTTLDIYGTFNNKQLARYGRQWVWVNE